MAQPDFVPLDEAGVSATVSYPPSGPFEYQMDVQGRKPPAWGGMDLGQRHGYVADFFERQGTSRPVALGIADALQKESGLRTTIVNPASGATGLPQYLGTRKDALLAQRDWTDPDVQLANMLREVRGGDKIAAAHWNEIKTAKTREQAAELWSKYFERPGVAPQYASYWNVSPGAIEREQNRSNTDLRFMTPEEYLSLLPPIEWNEANRAKRDNLAQSLAAGDNVEQIPSLDVTPRGDALHIADWDGRNRAQAAIAAGVDEIPVSLRGVPRGQENEFKLLVGDKKVSLPYTFRPVPQATQPVPLVGAAEQAQQTVPQAFAPGPQPIAPQAIPGPMVGPLAGPSSRKTDFYPEIAAGINSDIVNPRGIGYRGTGVPDLATNATVGGRIAAANAGSAGRIGLGGAIGSALSALNPVGTAQAAEPAGQDFVPMKEGTAPSPDSSADFAPMHRPVRSWIPPPPGLETLAPPAANFLFNYPTGLVLAALAAAQNPKSMADWSRLKAEAQGRMMVPENSVGRIISAILNSPGTLLASAINEMAALNIGGLTPEGVAAAAPYVDLATTILPLGGFTRGAFGNALRAPARSVLKHALQTPEMRTVGAINRAHAAEVAQGGMSAPAMTNALAEAHRLGVPQAPIHLATPGGPIDTLFKQSVEHSPEATGEVRQWATEQMEGPPVPSTTRLPAGGTRARMELATGQTFGFDNAFELGENIEREFARIGAAKEATGAELIPIEKGIAERRKFLLGKGFTEQKLASDKGLKRLEAARKGIADRIKELDRQERLVQANKSGLKWGLDILSPDVRPEHIRKFAKTAPPDAMTHLRAGVADTLIRHYRDNPGKEPFEVVEKTNVQDKLIAALEGSPAPQLRGKTLRTPTAAERAADFIDAAKADALLIQRNKNLLSVINREDRLSPQEKRAWNRVMAALAHFVTGLFTRAHVYSFPYWGIESMRRLADLSVSGGRVAPGARYLETTRMLRDPNAQLAGVPGLFAMPPRPSTIPVMRRSGSVFGPISYGPQMVGSAASPESINALSRFGPAMGYNFLAPQPTVPEAGP